MSYDSTPPEQRSSTRLPQRVYWRRRIMVLLVLAAIIAVVVLILWPRGGAADGDSGAEPTAESTASSTDDPTSSDSADPAGEIPACDVARITVEAITDASTYAADQQPQLSLSVKSTATEPCLFNAGSDVQVFEITSGDDAIWSSADCQVDPVSQEVVLEPGVPVSSASITWDRTRSSADTCDAPRDPVAGGGASYHLRTTVDGVMSITTKQFILE